MLALPEDVISLRHIQSFRLSTSIGQTEISTDRHTDRQTEMPHQYCASPTDAR